MTEMSDRVKRAIATADDADEAAKAAIREMRTPSPEMLAAAALPRTATAQEIWEAMIDGA
jgi:hypothetical protein